MKKELLFTLYEMHSPSGREKKMRRLLRKVANECGATSVETDEYGNLLIIKGESDTYPCLAAHIDQVQDKHSKDFRIVEIGEDVIGWSPKCHSQQGLGADDKNGVFVCLELLRKFDVMKVAFFVGEEVGCKGSSKVDLGFFKDCRFIIEPDRRGSSDLITSMYCGSVCSDEFEKAIGYERFGYKPCVGSVTDVGELTERGVGISCLNLSCGYYNAHTDEEITVLSELENCLNFVEHIVETCTDVYPFVNRYLDYYSGYYGRGGYSYGNYWHEDYGKHSGHNAEDIAAYYNDGYYDEDLQQMEEYLALQPDLTFEQIVSQYIYYFNAFVLLDRGECEMELKYMYESCKSIPFDKDTFFDDDDTLIGSTYFSKKVS